jgi:DnaJ-class molecular chaperone
VTARKRKHKPFPGARGDDGTFMKSCVAAVTAAGQYTPFDTALPREECSACEGSGLIWRNRHSAMVCGACKGVGRLAARRRVTVSKATIAAARGKVAIAKRTGQPISKAVQKIAEVTLADADDDW